MTPPDGPSADATVNEPPRRDAAAAKGSGDRGCADDVGDKGHDDSPYNPVVNDIRWASVLERRCPVVAGTFGTRQGLRIDSDMGPFCHVVRLP